MKTQNTPTFENLMAQVNNLNKSSNHDDIKSILIALAHYKPEPFEQDKTLRAIARHVGVALKTIRQEYALILKELNLQPNDIGFVVAQETLKKFYTSSALKRYPDGNFYIFDLTHWRVTTQDEVRSRLQEVAVDHLPYADGKSLRSLVSDAYGCLCDYLGTDDDILNFQQEPDPVINFQNGELWIEKDGAVELRPHKPESRLTYCLPFEYDPQAAAPKYEEALLGIFAKTSDPKDMCRHWHEFFGYAIQPRRNIACFFMLIGHGRNGKSSLLGTLQRMLGPSSVLNDNLSTFQKDRFNAAALHQKLVFIDDDLQTKITLNDGLLKKISEAKMMSARHPYGKTKFHFKCLALPVLAGNHYPNCIDMSQGMLRRINIFPFNRQFTKQEADPNLFEDIWEKEMPGVFNLALVGYLRLQKRGKFKSPVDCDVALNEFLTHSNPMWCFIEECLEDDPKGRIKFPEFRAYFEVWAKNQGFTKEPVLDKTLKRKLEGLGFDIVKNQGVATIKGFQFKSMKNAA